MQSWHIAGLKRLYNFGDYDCVGVYIISHILCFSLIRDAIEVLCFYIFCCCAILSIFGELVKVTLNTNGVPDLQQKRVQIPSYWMRIPLQTIQSWYELSEWFRLKQARTDSLCFDKQTWNWRILICKSIIGSDFNQKRHMLSQHDTWKSIMKYNNL